MVDNKEKLDISDRKLFERKETTDYLISLIDPLIKKYNSTEQVNNTVEQLSLF